MKKHLLSLLLLIVVQTQAQEFIQTRMGRSSMTKNTAQKINARDTLKVEAFHLDRSVSTSSNYGGFLLESDEGKAEKKVIINRWHRITPKEGKSFWQISDDSTERLGKTSLLSFAQGSSGSIYSELLSDRLGKWKISFGSVITAAKNDTSTTVQNFLNGGGNFILRLTAPISKIHHISEPDRLNACLFFIPRVAANVPKTGEDNVLGNWNVDIGFEVHAKMMGLGNNIGLLGKVRAAGVYGSSEFTNKIIKNSQTFGYMQASIGILLDQRIMIQANIEPFIWGNTVGKIPTRIGIQTSF